MCVEEASIPAVLLDCYLTAISFFVARVRRDRDAYLLELMRDNTQLLINKMWEVCRVHVRCACSHRPLVTRMTMAIYTAASKR